MLTCCLCGNEDGEVVLYPVQNLCADQDGCALRQNGAVIKALTVFVCGCDSGCPACDALDAALSAFRAAPEKKTEKDPSEQTDFCRYCDADLCGACFDHKADHGVDGPDVAMLGSNPCPEFLSHTTVCSDCAAAKDAEKFAEGFAAGREAAAKVVEAVMTKQSGIPIMIRAIVGPGEPKP